MMDNWSGLPISTGTMDQPIVLALMLEKNKPLTGLEKLWLRSQITAYQYQHEKVQDSTND